MADSPQGRRRQDGHIVIRNIEVLPWLVIGTVSELLKPVKPDYRSANRR
jgi:hypothetical protein